MDETKRLARRCDARSSSEALLRSRVPGRVEKASPRLLERKVRVVKRDGEVQVQTITIVTPPPLPPSHAPATTWLESLRATAQSLQITCNDWIPFVCSSSVLAPAISPSRRTAAARSTPNATTSSSDEHVSAKRGLSAKMG